VHDLFQVRREVLELAGLARLQPFHLGLRRRLGQARNQRHRCGDGEIALATHLAQVGDLPVLESAGTGLRTVEQPGDFRCRDQCVVFGLERGELFTANIGAAARHHHRGIPAKDGHGSPEGMQAFPFLLELLVGGLGHDEKLDGGRVADSLPATPSPASGARQKSVQDQ
jgi:hypothetical protein